MLEFQPSAKVGVCIGRKALSYKRNGVSATKDQTISEYREEIIADTIKEDLALSKADLATARTGALAILFPESEKQGRQKFRSKLASDTRALFQQMTMSWPTEDIQNRMILNDEMNQAYECQDLIAYRRAFNKFCLNSSGNLEVSIQNAEKDIGKIIMRALDLPGYVIAFSRAAENLRAVGSLWSEFRIVSAFVKNLNSDKAVFGQIYRDFTNKHTPAFAMQAMTLPNAIHWVEDHFKEVIMPEYASKKEELLSLLSVKEVNNRINQLSKRGGSALKAEGMTKVPLAVLATILSEKRKSEEELAAERKRSKALKAGKGNAAATPKVAAATPKAAAPESKYKTKCNLFKSKDGCKYGDNCKFSHEA
jgi:uncharacterized small protein (DUF1192 family)